MYSKRTKVKWLGLFKTVLLHHFILLPLACSQQQNDCEKSCIKECNESDYSHSHPSDFRICVKEKYYAKCFNKNPSSGSYLYHCLITAGFLTIFGIIRLCCCTYKPESRLPTDSSVQGGNGLGAADTNNSVNGPSRSSPHVIFNSTHDIIDIPSTVPDQNEDKPPRYSEPPSYNECTVSVNFNNEVNQIQFKPD